MFLVYLLKIRICFFFLWVMIFMFSLLMVIFKNFFCVFCCSWVVWYWLIILLKVLYSLWKDFLFGCCWKWVEKLFFFKVCNNFIKLKLVWLMYWSNFIVMRSVKLYKMMIVKSYLFLNCVVVIVFKRVSKIRSWILISKVKWL